MQAKNNYSKNNSNKRYNKELNILIGDVCKDSDVNLLSMQKSLKNYKFNRNNNISKSSFTPF